MSQDQQQVLRHPIFGHTLANCELPHHKYALSLKGPLVHVKAVVKRVEPDKMDGHVGHMHFLIDHIEVVTIKGADKSLVLPEAFCAVRFGDNLGLKQRILGLEEGQPIEMQGEYIDKNHAYATPDNPGDPVLHFTHHPVGYVLYHNKRYE
jgi:hypothetical protein